MVIYFKSEKALEHLLRTGQVYTLRAERRRTGRDWIKTSRNGKKVADVVIEEVKRVEFKTMEEKFSMMKGVLDYTDVSEIEPYVQHSGFSSAREWLEEYWKLAGWRAPYAWLYRVILVVGN